MRHPALLGAIESPAVSAHRPDQPDRVVRRSVIKLLGTATGLVYRVDAAEVERRSCGGLGALKRLDLLDALMRLPAGFVVPWGGLAPADQRLLTGLPAGIVERSEAGVVRLAVAPAIPDLAVVAVRDWRRGLGEGWTVRTLLRTGHVAAKASGGL